LAYVAGQPDPAVRQYVAVSMIEGRFELDESALDALRVDLRRRIARGDRDLVSHQFSFCASMLATPQSLYSYLSWTPEKLLEASRNTKVKIDFIVGSKDDRLGADWVERLRKTGRQVQVIDGANHFMDGEHEFALLDTVLDLIQKER
jgi:pimeloyl-ACP methyl ester carboxylesterase